MAGRKWIRVRYKIKRVETKKERHCSIDKLYNREWKLGNGVEGNQQTSTAWLFRLERSQMKRLLAQQEKIKIKKGSNGWKMGIDTVVTTLKRGQWV